MDIRDWKGIPMLQRKTCAVLVVILALLVGPARAQQAQHDQHHPDAAAAAPAAMPGGSSMPGAGASGMPMMAAMAGHVEGRLAFLKTELKINDAQLPSWNAFAQAARENAKAMEEMMQGGGGMMEKSQTATLPDKLAAREKMLSARLDVVRKLKAAAEPLYAALSADQKKTADEIMVSPMGMMM
jgi:hypothetical protein